MLYKKRSTLWMGLMLCGAACLPAYAADKEAEPPANAALEYWMGFGAMPALDEAQQKVLDEWLTAPLDGTAARIIELSKASLTSLRQAASMPTCNWGLHYELGPEMLMPHAPKSRTLTQLAGLRARSEFEQGDYRAGVDDVLAALVLARRVGADIPLISLLVQHAMERSLLSLTAPYLAQMDAATLQHLSAGLEALPPGGSLHRSILGEKVWIIEWLNKELQEGQEAQWLPLLLKIAASENMEGQAAVRAAVQASAPLSAAWKAKLLEDLNNYYDALLKLVDQPQEQIAAHAPVLFEQLKTTNPVAALFAPFLEKANERDLAGRTQRALFQAAIAIVREGPDKVKDFRNAAGEPLFEYQALANGFALRSKVMDRDRPLTLTVGGTQKP